MTPYRPYRIGQVLNVSKYSRLYNTIDGYYRSCNGKVKIVSEGINYAVMPVGSKDILDANYVDLVPDLVRSRFYVPAELVREGVAVKLMSTFEYRVISRHESQKTVLENGSKIDKNELVEILRRRDDLDNLTDFIRE